MWRHIASNALTFFIVLLFLFAGGISFAVKKYSAAGPLEQAICLQVKSGANMRAVALDLQAQGLLLRPMFYGLVPIMPTKRAS